MDSDDTPDFELCEYAIRALCTREQLRALDTPPRWHLGPPQREEFMTPEKYAIGMRGYADRVISENTPVCHAETQPQLEQPAP